MAMPSFSRAPDGGTTWQKLSGQYLFTAKSITIDPNNPSNIYVVDNFGVQRSTDGGTTFATITPTFPGGVFVQSFALDSSTGDLYFATYNQIEVSTDHGATWKALPPRPNPHVLIGLGNQVFAGVDSPYGSVRGEVESGRLPDALLHLLRRQLFGSDHGHRCRCARRGDHRRQHVVIRFSSYSRPSPRLRRWDPPAALWRS